MQWNYYNPDTGMSVPQEVNGTITIGQYISPTITTGERWKFCPRDGFKLEDGFNFCPQCGQQVGTVGLSGWWGNGYVQPLITWTTTSGVTGTVGN